MCAVDDALDGGFEFRVSQNRVTVHYVCKGLVIYDDAYALRGWCWWAPGFVSTFVCYGFFVFFSVGVKLGDTLDGVGLIVVGFYFWSVLGEWVWWDADWGEVFVDCGSTCSDPFSWCVVLCCEVVPAVAEYRYEDLVVAGVLCGGALCRVVSHF